MGGGKGSDPTVTSEAVGEATLGAGATPYASAAYCRDWPDVLAKDAEELEIALRALVDEDDAVDIARLVLDLGWRKP